MQKLLAVFVLPLLVASCGGSAASSSSPDTPADKSAAASDDNVAKGPISFVFAWKMPCRVPVEQVETKKGHTVRLRYMLSAKPGPEGNIDVDLGDFEFLEMDGQDLTTPKMQAELAPALALTTMMPTMVVSPEGDYVRVRGLEALVDRVVAHMGKGMDKQKKAKLATMMRSPRILQMVQAKSGDYWNGWVGAWTGLELAASASREGDDVMDVGGVEIPVRLRYENHGPVKGTPGFYRVSLSSTMAGNSASTGVLALMRSILQDAGSDMPTDVQVDHVSIVNKVEVVTEPATLLPHRARRERTMELVMAGDRKKRVEVREETFDWKHAEGCR
ncbi:MAG: hypothetical protein IPM54_01475 [Polyangiaceae bacterium]|nr:hypothetical protein [Polyangiaceae bacterium]